MWAHDATPQGGGRAQQGTTSPGAGAEGCLEGVGPSKQGGGRSTSHLCGGEGDEDITGDSPADIQEQRPVPGQPRVVLPRLQQPVGQGAVGQVDMGMSPQSLSWPSLALPEQVVPQAGTGAARRAPQLRAALGRAEDAEGASRVLRLHRHVAALSVLITPRQLWGGWEQVTSGHHSIAGALGARAGMGGHHSPEQLFCPSATSGRGVNGERGETPKSGVSPPSVQRRRGREGRKLWQLPGLKGTVLQLCGQRSELVRAQPLCPPCQKGSQRTPWTAEPRF